MGATVQKFEELVGRDRLLDFLGHVLDYARSAPDGELDDTPEVIVKTVLDWMGFIYHDDYRSSLTKQLVMAIKHNPRCGMAVRRGTFGNRVIIKAI